jgi:hypothetical protein
MMSVVAILSTYGTCEFGFIPLLLVVGYVVLVLGVLFEAMSDVVA